MHASNLPTPLVALSISRSSTTVFFCAVQHPLVPGRQADTDLCLLRLLHLTLVSLPHQADINCSSSLLQSQLVLFDVAIQHGVRGIDNFELLVVDEASLLVLATIIPALVKSATDPACTPTHDRGTSAQLNSKRERGEGRE